MKAFAMKKMKKLAKYSGLALIIPIAMAVAFTFFAPRFGWTVDIVFSSSMEPELKVGSVAITRPVEAQDIRVGDIITFHSPLDGKLTSHRVVGVEEGSSFHFQTKGDAAEDGDSFVVPAQNVVGKVCFHLPYFGYVVQFLKSPLGFILTVCIPGLIIIALEVRNIWRVLDEEEIKKKHRVEQAYER
jgi:signal peptidase